MKDIILVIIIIALITTLISGCEQGVGVISQNKNIVEIKDFHVKSDSTELETSARGTVFLSGEKGEVPELAQIVVFVEVDPDDWGGVVIHLSDQWNITSITSSFPNDNNNSPSVWTTADTPDHGWNKFIEIGRDRTRYSPTGGGKGTVIIELEINKDTLSTSDVLRMGVAVGSKEKDGVRIANPDSKDIGIPISIP